MLVEFAKWVANPAIPEKDVKLRSVRKSLIPQFSVAFERKRVRGAERESERSGRERE